MQEEGASSKPGGHNILVAVRSRALLPQERAAGGLLWQQTVSGFGSRYFADICGGHAIITICNGTTVILEDPHTTAADDYLRKDLSFENETFPYKTAILLHFDVNPLARSQ